MKDISQRGASLKVIAKEAGTSISTVSGILNGNSAFSEKRRKQIWDIATRLNYKPNQEARSLRQGNGVSGTGRVKTGIIMHLSHILGDNIESANDSFERNRCFLLSMLAQKNNLQLFHYWYYNLTFSCPPLLNGLVDGAIVGTQHFEIIETLRKYRVPLVLLDVPFSVNTAYEAMVNFDIRLGMALLLGRLQSLGHRRIAVFRTVGGKDKNDYHGFRWFKLQEANASINMDIDEKLSSLRIISPETHDAVVRDFAASAAPKIKSGEISAIMCLDDIYADSIIPALMDLRMKIPEDVSVSGFSRNLPLASPTTSILNDWEAASAATMELLKERIARPDTTAREILIKPILVEGTTVAAPNHKT